MVDAGGVVIWLGSAREDLVRGTVPQVEPRQREFEAPGKRKTPRTRNVKK